MITIWFKNPEKFTQEQVFQEAMFVECNRIYVSDVVPMLYCITSESDWFVIDCKNIDYDKSRL